MATKDTVSQLTNQDKQNLLLRTPYALPDNPTTKGFSASQIKSKMYEGQMLLFEWLSRLQSQLRVVLDKYDSGENKVNSATYSEFATKDGSGNTIVNEYETKSDAQTKQTQIYQALADLEHSELHLNDIVDNLNSAETQKVLSARQGSVIRGMIEQLDQLKASITYVDTAVGAEATSREQADNELDLSKVNYSDVINDLISTDTNKPLSAYQGKLLKGQIDAINLLLESDDTTLDELQEIVTYIKNNKSLIDNITINKVNYSDIVDNLTSEISDKPLSAKQGKLLKDLYDALGLSLEGTQGTLETHTADTDIHITAQERTNWNAKQERLTAGNGITLDNDTVSSVITSSPITIDLK